MLVAVTFDMRLSLQFVTGFFLPLALLLFPTLTPAQSPTPTGEVHFGVGEAGLGYSYVNDSIAPPNRVGLHGLDANATLDIPARFSIKIDLGYTRAANVFNTDRHADMLTYLVGPVLYPVARGKFGTYVHALIGGARITGPVPTSTGFFTAFANKFAWDVGGGLDYRLTRFSPRLSVRIGADYLHTAYFDPTQTISGRSNVRAVVGVVYSFRSRR
jgi:opacity protein-like surface antigen